MEKVSLNLAAVISNNAKLISRAGQRVTNQRPVSRTRDLDQSEASLRDTCSLSAIRGPAALSDFPCSGLIDDGGKLRFY